MKLTRREALAVELVVSRAIKGEDNNKTGAALARALKKLRAQLKEDYRLVRGRGKTL